MRESITNDETIENGWSKGTKGSWNVQPLRLWTARRAGASDVAADPCAWTFSSQLSGRFDAAQRAFWLHCGMMNAQGAGEERLHSLVAAYDFIAHTGGEMYDENGIHPIQYLVLASGRQGAFHYGSDYGILLRLIEAGDRQGLLYYGLICAELTYRTYIACGLPLTGIALVQGECFGGGFETALACDLIVAEERATFGFPEITFGLFPGTGAYALLLRRVGHRKAEELLTEGKCYTAREMADLGLVDYVAADGAGAAELDQLIRSRSRTHTALFDISAARRNVERLELEELHAVVHAWADCALQLTERDKQLMRHLVERQNGLLSLFP